MSKQFQLTFEDMWDIILACDSSYDGVFYTAVKTTKIYCRPSCKSRKPKKINVEFYEKIEEVELAGFRACKRCQPNVDRSPAIDIVEKAKRFLEMNYKQKVLLQDIADHIGVSSFYLERLFKQHTSQTPRSYLTKIRIRHAEDLLQNSTKTNLEICYEVGFQSPSNFYQSFQRLRHCSPSEFRGEYC